MNAETSGMDKELVVGNTGVTVNIDTDADGVPTFLKRDGKRKVVQDEAEIGEAGAPVVEEDKPTIH